MLQLGPGGREADPAVDADRPEGVLYRLKMVQVVVTEQVALLWVIGMPGLGLTDDDGGEFRVLDQDHEVDLAFHRALGQFDAGEVEHPAAC